MSSATETLSKPRERRVMRIVSQEDRSGWLAALPPLAFLLIFFVVPTILLFVTSFFTARSFVIEHVFNIDNYVRTLSATGFWLTTWTGMKNGFYTAVATIILSYPVAYYIVYRARGNIILYLVLLSWFSSYLVRVYAWRTILGTNGLINSFLIQIGVISQPLEVLLFSPLATVITLVHIMLPFALLILVSALRDVKQDYLDAARDLGASPLQMLTKVILPMTHNGIVGSFMFTFILAAGDYITPQLLGGRDGITSGLLIANQFRSAGNWPLKIAMAVILMTLFVGVYVALRLALRVANLAPGRHYHR